MKLSSKDADHIKYYVRSLMLARQGGCTHTPSCPINTVLTIAQPIIQWPACQPEPSKVRMIGPGEYAAGVFYNR